MENNFEQKLINIVSKEIPNTDDGKIMRELAADLGWSRAAEIFLKHKPELELQLQTEFKYYPGKRVNIGKEGKYGIIKHTYSGRSYTVAEYFDNGTMNNTITVSVEQLDSYN